jgi:NADPH-dependent 2,4-dienoyl-CoA reductase/sulfur reductase-like enzyme
MSLFVKKELRSGIPVWMAYPRRAPGTRQMDRDLKTDILVVGAGISGALIAYSLARERHRVVVIDRPKSSLLHQPFGIPQLTV